MPTFSDPVSSRCVSCAEAPRHPQQRLQLREAEGEQLIRLEPPLRLLRHHDPALAAQHLDRVERRVERAGDALGL